MRKGFTLIELLVVVLIMGILASVAMPQYFKSVEKSRAAEAVDAISAMYSAQERAFMQKGSFVTSLSELDIGISNLNYFTITTFAYDNANQFSIRFQRNTAAGGGLGSYRIALRIPLPPDRRIHRWECAPEKAGCVSFLPKFNGSQWSSAF
ncbi:MAG: prepilin-type N-terminal cleavage/methylation domain-containing protein [Elusimicrobiales bacterium]|nr:prepilin-type N-terminal cleavage/methylation domain-containing protein [Elusimicrobiales bacterium]